MKPVIAAALLLGALTAAGCAGPPTQGYDPNAPAFEYTALGASDAVGVGAFPLTDGYVYRIRDELEEQGLARVRLLNLGVPQATADEIEDIVRLVWATGQPADLFTLWTGPNDVVAGDSVQDFEADLARILGYIREKTSAVVVMANVPDLTQLPRFREQPNNNVTRERIRAFNEAIARQANEFDVPVVDLFSQMPRDELVSDLDGFHPSNRGHERIAELFLEKIRPELGL